MDRNARLILRRLEGGASITVQSILYIFVLFASFALVYDMGNVALVAQIANAAAMTAAQDAAKEISQGGFKSGQRVTLDPEALARAAETVAGMLPTPARDLSIALRAPNGRSAISVTFRVRAATPILRACFGLGGIEIPVGASAEPAWGLEAEWQ